MSKTDQKRIKRFNEEVVKTQQIIGYVCSIVWKNTGKVMDKTVIIGLSGRYTKDDSIYDIKHIGEMRKLESKSNSERFYVVKSEPIYKQTNKI